MWTCRLLPMLLLVLWGRATPAAQAPLPVLVGVAPLALPVLRVGGERVAVQVLVRPGQHPHGYEPTPRQVAELSRVRLILLTGAPFERRLLERLQPVHPEPALLDLAAVTGAATAMPRHAEGHEHGSDHPGEHHHHGTGKDSHIWTSPPHLRTMAAAIRDSLSELDPENAAAYRGNYRSFAADLDALDQELRQRLQGLRQPRFLVYHPAWGWFAETYGLQQLAIEQDGKEPGARALTRLIEQARRDNLGFILVQPQFSTRAAERVATAIGARLVTLDPLDPDVPATLRRLARVLADAEE
jgi:zinc transport system substrate-binding protein